MTKRTRARLAAALLLASCKEGGSSRDGGGQLPPGDGGDGSPVSHLESLPTAGAFAALQGEGWAVKYLAATPGKRPPASLDRPCLFQNTARYPLHINFARTLPGLADLDFESYRAMALKSATRVLWAGELQLLPAAPHPTTGKLGVVAYFVYSDPPDAMSVEELAAVDARIKGCAPYARDLLVLVGSDPEQMRDFTAKAPALAGRGVMVGDAARLRPVVGAEGYSAGEAVGYLRIVPPGERAESYGPRDVLVTEGVQEDLGLVAGLITSLPQNLHSHVNLRLREKQIPNARVPDIYQNPALAMLDGRLIRVTVSASEARLEPATLMEAEEFWAAHRPPAQTLSADLGEGRVQELSALGFTSVAAYGTKAANLAELFRLLPPANRSAGFAVPFQAHRSFMADSGLTAVIDRLLDDPRARTDAAFRRAALAEVRRATEAVRLPAAFLTTLQQPAESAFGSSWRQIPLRFRSSSNVEDGELVSGAGLHDSARGCYADDLDGDEVGPSACLSSEERAAMEAELARRQAELAAFPGRRWLPEIIEDLSSDLARERTVERAVKKVYASLWNERAFEEREYYRMDHRQAFMGLAVNAAFVRERLDAVALTNLPSAAGLPLYRVVSQKDGQPVVRPPDPTLVAETVTFRRGADGQPAEVQLITPSSLSPDKPLWPAPRMAELAGLLFQIQDHFARVVYPRISPLSLDMEIKLTADDRIVVKQARPYRASTTPE